MIDDRQTLLFRFWTCLLVLHILRLIAMTKVMIVNLDRDHRFFAGSTSFLCWLHISVALWQLKLA